jgi:tetratricopeptide (TPR) repeat protein
MNKILVYIFCMISFSFLQANDWQEYWIKAVEQCDKKEYDSAKELFDLAICLMEENRDLDHPYIYVDRARLNLLLENNVSALADLDKALSNEKITKREKSRAIISRLIARSRLGMEKGVLEDLKNFAENSEDRPVFEKTKDHIIIRNVPDCSCYNKLMTCYFIHSGVCFSKNDIQKLSSGIWLVKKDCSCKECNEILNNDRLCDACGSIIQADSNKEKIETCKGWCDRMAVAGASWCAKVFKTLKCQTACALAVYQIQQGCYWCCEGEGFYKRCIKPFEDIGKYIQAPCDPMWD